MSQNKDYYESEKSKWDSVMHKLYGNNPEKLILRPEQDFYHYARTDSVAKTCSEIIDFLPSVEGKDLLEYGCGSGYTAALLAKSGANVTAFDISEQSVYVTRMRAELNKLDNLGGVVAVGESLPWDDNTFDVIFGRAVLHHLDVSEGGPELYRVLKPGGKALFIEPMGMNPVLNFVRDYVPYPNKNPVGDDSPLNYDEINRWGEGYTEYKYQEVQFLGMLERAFPYKWHVDLPILHKIDNVLLKNITPLRGWSRYVVMMMTK